MESEDKKKLNKASQYSRKAKKLVDEVLNKYRSEETHDSLRVKGGQNE